MTQLRYLFLFAFLGLTGGCVPRQFLNPGDSGTTPVPSNPFGTLAPQGAVRQTSFSSARGEGSARVNAVAHKIFAANGQLGVKPLFATIGSPHPELFHQGTALICITDGLVKMCKTEAELAALLSLELGRTVADREALAPPKSRNPDPRPPIEVPIGNAGQVVAPDPARVAELIRYENERKRAAQPTPPPDPMVLARTYLANAGYPRNALDTVAPLIDAADRTYSLERQFKTTPPSTSWSPAPDGQP